MPTIGVMAVGGEAVASGLAISGVKAGAAVAAVTRTYGLMLVARVKAHAAGRPGPRIVTGDYNRSISMVFGLSGGDPTAWVGTNAPQGRRLEFGFVGADALGRHFNQPPYPHFGPAIDSIREEYVTAVGLAVAGAV